VLKQIMKVCRLILTMLVNKSVIKKEYSVSQSNVVKRGSDVVGISMAFEWV
jgi:hypothetical protein